jgi:GT2 family glycosyltransferase
MDVSVIIVSYNTVELTLVCLESIRKFTNNLSYEIIVVDNASVDGSAERIKNSFHDVLVIPLEKNYGFGVANNIGTKKASGKYLFFLNSDTELIENSIKAFHDYHEHNNGYLIGALGCKMLDKDKKVHISYGNFPSILQEVFEFGLSKIWKTYYREKLSPAVIDQGIKPKEVDYIIGADLFLSKLVFEKNGGFDSDFFLYYEETELCFRLKKNGYKILWFPETSIIHHLGSSGSPNNKFNYQTFYLLQKSKKLFYKKCYGLISLKLMEILSIPKLFYKYKGAKAYSLISLFLFGKSN